MNKSKNWIVNNVTGEIFFKDELILFSSDLIIDHFGYAGFDMCLQIELTKQGGSEDYYFESFGGHGEGIVIQNLPGDTMQDENKHMNEQLENYLNNYDYTLVEFLKLPKQAV